MSRKQDPATILIVDDTEQNVQLLAHVVKKEGFNVLAAFSGPDALEIVKKKKPDIILLDVMMPEMNGFEVCKELKSDENLNDVPVIFLSALTETDSKVKGFEVGGVDYITKPFQREEVLARIRLHVRLTRLQNELERKIMELKEREQRLNRLNQDKDELMRVVGHDIRNPVTGIIGISEILQKRGDQLPPNERKHMFQTIRESGQKLLSLVNDLLQKETAERGITDLQLEDVELDQLIESVINLHQPTAITKDIKFEFNLDEAPTLRIDRQKIDQVIGNLISNALKFTPDKGTITVNVFQQVNNGRDIVKIEVSDTGVGIPEEKLDHLFEGENGQNVRLGTSGEVGSGIGLQIIKQFTELHNGTIDVKSEVGEGTTFVITLPRVYSGDKIKQ